MKRQSMQLRFMIPALLIVFFLVLSIYQQFDERGHMRKIVEENISVIARTDGSELAGNLEYFMTNNNLEHAEKIISWEGSHPNLTIAVLVDQENRILMGTDYRLKTKPLETIPSLASLDSMDTARLSYQPIHELAPDRLTYMTYYPVRLGRSEKDAENWKTGVLYMEYDLKEQKKEMLALALEGFYFHTGLVFVVCLLLWGVIKIKVTDRLENLVECCKRVGEGDLSERVAIKGNDELSYLSQSFNRMVGNLQEDRKIIQENEGKYRMLFEEANDPLFLIDRETVGILDCNQKAIKAFGYDLDELKNMTMFHLICDEWRDHCSEILDALCNGESVETIECRYRKKNGWIIPVEISPALIVVKGRELILLNVRHIGERKEAEAAIHEQSVVLESFFKHSLDCIAILDRDFNFIRVNDAYADVHKRDHSEFMCHNYFEFYPAESRALFQKVVETKEPYVELGGRFRDVLSMEQNNVSYWDWKLAPVLDEEGNVILLIHTSRDVTRKKRDEETLRLSEEKYRSLIESAGDAIFIADGETGNIVDANKQAEKLTGRSKEELITMHQSQLHPPEEAEFHRKVFEEHTNTEFAFARNVRVRHRDGHDTHVSISASTLEIGGRKVIQGIFRDITERIENEREIREKQELLLNIINNIPHSVFWKDRDSTYLGCNANFAEVAGLEKPEDIVGKNDFDLPLAEGQAVMVQAKDREVMLEEKCLLNFEEPIQREDGSIATLLTSKVPLHNTQGEVIGLVGIFADITERKAIEEELRKLSNVVEQTVEMVIITDTEGTIEYVNRAVEEITGYTNDELIGCNPRILNAGKNSKEFYRNMWEKILSGETWQGETVNKKKNGEIIYLDMTVSPVSDRSGKITHYVSLQRDITEEKKLHQQLLHSEKLSSIGTFVSGVAHELNNPLTAILGFSNYLLKKNVTQEEAKEKLAIISEETNRAAEIVQSLLRYSRRAVTGKHAVQLNDVLKAALNVQKYRFSSSAKIRLDENYADGLPEITGNNGELQQVFVNIISNAYHALEENDTRDKDGYLKISTVAEEDMVVVSFENNGPTIPPDEIERIFDPFYTTKEVGDGTGLGLFLSYRIINDHGGKISVENLNDSGVRFTIRLPMRKERAETRVVTASRKPVAVASQNREILIIEDEIHIREWLEFVLLAQKFSITMAENGKEGLELIKKRHFDLVLSDIQMPEMDGYELVRWMLKNKVEQVSKTVLVTGAITDEVEAFCGEYRCNYLRKPFSEETVLGLIQRIMEASFEGDA